MRKLFVAEYVFTEKGAKRIFSLGRLHLRRDVPIILLVTKRIELIVNERSQFVTSEILIVNKQNRLWVNASYPLQWILLFHHLFVSFWPDSYKTTFKFRPMLAPFCHKRNVLRIPCQIAMETTYVTKVYMSYTWKCVLVKWHIWCVLWINHYW